MALFEEWCACNAEQNGRKRLLKFHEKEGGRTATADQFLELVRSHYDTAERIAEDIASLGYAGAAAIIAERLPRTARSRSGELGEILGSELVEQQLGFRIPIRRLRYKDGREMALRGDDFIGVRVEENGELALLKGEAKSRANLAAATVTEARSTLNRDAGRPTASSLIFVADRLMDGDDEDAQLGRLIRNEVANRAVPAHRIDHALFAVSGNAAPQALEDDLQSASNDRNQTVAHLRIEDHQAFIQMIYEGALALGDL